MGSDTRVRVALLNDYEVVARGLHAMLAPFESRIEVVELDIHVPVAGPVDVALYDTFAGSQVDGDHIDTVLTDGRSEAVVVYTWNMQPQLVEIALAKGVRGYLDKSTPAGDLVTALERVAAGAVVVSSAEGAPEDAAEPLVVNGEWPGRAHGLSPREAEVVALIAQGLTNTDIAARTYLSINSVKTYIRTAYRKMGVERRSQAVLWGIDHDMLPGRTRISTSDPIPVTSYTGTKTTAE